MLPFQTLNQEIEVEGIGLHCGQPVSMRLMPTQRLGWRFSRVDLPGQPEIRACLENVIATQHATVLSENGVTISTTEHLLAALWVLGITHARIEINGPEIPILDGSSLLWVQAIQRAGTRLLEGERPIFALSKPVWWEKEGASIIGLPHSTFRLSVAVNFEHPWAEAQIADYEMNQAIFAREIAPARTFTLEKWIEPLRSAGLIRGGSTENALVISTNGISSPLRFPDEIARHKALDCLGDLALLFGENGGALYGQIIATRAGHGPHRAWMDLCCNSDALQPL